MPINEAATIQDDHASLSPAQLLCTVQGLLLSHSSESDEVRALLATGRIDFAGAAFVPTASSEADHFTCLDLLESPFFVIENLRPLPEPRQVNVNASGSLLSGSITKTARAVLDAFYGYEITFLAWDKFEEEIEQENESLRSLGVLPHRFKNWYTLLKDLLSQSLSSNMRSETGEVQELTVLHNVLALALEAFNFSMKVKNGTDDDATCFKLSTKQEFLFSEGKESACLPRLLATDGHHLCSVGFATKVARTQWKAPSDVESPTPEWHSGAEQNNSYRNTLQQYLKLSSRKDKSCTSTSVQPSEITNKILRNHQEIAAAVDVVHARAIEGKVEPHDPVNLWAAVMQACHYSVEKSRAVTIVQSAKMWWFIQLGSIDSNSNCELRVSTASMVGSRDFLTTVIKFLTYASNSRGLEQGHRRSWEKALVKANRGPRRARRKRRGQTPNQEPNDVNIQSGGKRQCAKRSSGKALSRSSAGSICSKKFAVVPSVSCDSEETDSCFGYDDYGMAIPWFDQIGDTSTA